jgi:hypothetical protein
MCHDQDAAAARHAYSDKTLLLERMLGIWEGCRQWILERGNSFSEGDAVLPEVGGGLCRIPFDDHAPSIAEVAFGLLVCPTLELSCEAPIVSGFVSFNSLFCGTVPT